MPIKTDVVVVGAGVAGLMLTQKLLELGLDALLIEKAESVAGGASTRNEGWLHRGTYHATSIRDRREAIEIARRCIYGHQQVRLYAPQALYSPLRPSYALLRDSNRFNEITSRWREAEVKYEKITHRQFLRIEPNVRLDRGSCVFRVRDVSINTTTLYRKLVWDIRRMSRGRAGSDLLLSSRIANHEGTDLELHTRKGRLNVRAKMVIYTTGYSTEAVLVKTTPFRYFKSHLIVMPSVTNHSVFCLDPDEAAMMIHGSNSERAIVGQNEDAELVPEPRTSVDHSSVLELRNALSRLIRQVPSWSETRAVACIKVDSPGVASDARSLGIKIGEVERHHFWILPGKMTETPFMTDKVASMVSEWINDPHVSLRPMDRMPWANTRRKLA